MVEPVMINRSTDDRSLTLYDDRFIPRLSELVDVVHKNGAKVGVQLNHLGRQGNLILSKDAPPAVAPSPLPWAPGGEPPREQVRDEINFPVIKIVNNAITKRMDRQVRVESGAVRPEQDEGIIKLGLVRPDGGITTGLVSGFGDRIGGLGTSLGVYNNKLVILGCSDQDMAIATNRMLDLGGGIVLVKAGRIISEVPLAVAGLQSREEVSTFAGQMRNMKRDLQAFGCFLEDPFYTIHFLTMSGLPYLRILPKGILDVVKNEIVFPVHLIC